jgi:hypothetical protein
MKLGLSALLATAFATGTLAAERTGWDFIYKPFSGEYVIYSGELGETAPPTRTDRKLSLMITGQLAREMFDSMGPDIKNTCGADGGGRIRRKQNISCNFYPGDEYTCYLGVNLRNGDSIRGSTC